jgi:cellulose synthase/poly-beta-1,6-N-acetylglucosamine synthase-like glycosyltransferase
VSIILTPGMLQTYLHSFITWVQYERHLVPPPFPLQIRNAMQQRSRWAKGHFQIVYSREHCPLLSSKLSWPMRLLYCSAVYSYIVCCISTPFFQSTTTASLNYNVPSDQSVSAPSNSYLCEQSLVILSNFGVPSTKKMCCSDSGHHNLDRNFPPGDQ